MLLSSKQIADRYGITVKTLHNWRAAGYVVSWKKVGERLIKFEPQAIEEIDAFLKWRQSMQDYFEAYHRGSWPAPKTEDLPHHMIKDSKRHYSKWKNIYYTDERGFHVL